MPDREALQEIERLLADADRHLGKRDAFEHGWVNQALGRVRALLAEPPVPDEQAIERAAKYLCTVSFSSLPDCGGDRKDIARAVLAAALEPPE